MNHDQIAEENVLGAVLLHGSVPHVLSSTLSPKHFYRESHRIVYHAMLTLTEAGKPTTGITVADLLKKWGKLDTVGGESRIAELVALTPAVGNVGHHAEIVRDAAGRRELLAAGQKIQQIAEAGTGELDDVIRQAEELLYHASERTTTRSAVALTAGMDEFLDEIRTAIETHTPITGMSTGFSNVDHVLRGFWPGQLIILAALTGRGKSTFAFNIAENIADAGKSVFFVSLEMSRRELQAKSLSRAGGIDSDLLSTGNLDAHAQMKMAEAIAKVNARGTRLLVHDDGLNDTAALAATARRHHEQEPLGLIVVDYLGLMNGTGETQALRMASISRALKLLAMNLNVPVLGLAQFNRSFAGRTEKRPVLTDLKDTSSLEQDADVVMFLHNEADHDDTVEDDGSVELIVAKNRRGKSGTVELLWTRKYNRFSVPSSQPRVN